ncbi:MAG TPA: amidohydrolase family protein [Steroidobacteraceae bacterium]|jgi:5-methylthioadenosine/S-adenosylhomocysteine deaminase|nr:amidohydrolase family protein [Steroidobacteraceae bacterium]
MSIRQSVDLLIEPRWLLPIAPANTVLEHHAVALAGGRIVALGPAAQLQARFLPREHLVRTRHALLPGLVNAHTSACHALLRGLPVRAPRLRWLAETLAPLGQRGFGADFVRDGTRLGIAAMLRAGITCFADLAPLPEESARAVAAARMRAAIALPVTDLASPWADGASDHLARAEALWDEYRSDSRITLYFAPRAGASDATLIRVRRVADELEARIALHLAELAPAAAEGGALPAGVADSAPPPRAGGAAVRRLAELGLLRPGCSVIGMLGCDAGELALLAHHGAAVIACPQAELRLGAVPGPLALPEGHRTGLGSDSPAAAGACDLLAEARLAALLSGWSAAQALRVATLGGATTLGLAAEIGSIEPGKAADLTCIDLEESDAGHAARVAEAIVFGATRSQVSDVWTAGRAAVSGGRLLLFDETELAGLPARWAQRLALEAAA